MFPMVGNGGQQTPVSPCQWEYSPSVTESLCNPQSRDRAYLNALGSLKEAAFVGTPSQLAPF